MDRVKGDCIDGYTSLHKAVFHSDVDKLKALLDAKGEMEQVECGRPYPDRLQAKWIKVPFDVNARCILKQTALILCVRQHYEEKTAGKGDIMCKMLLEAGAKVLDDEGRQIRDDYGDGILHLAAMATQSNGAGILKMLVEKVKETVTNPADLTEVISESDGNFKNTPLHWITLNGDVEAAKYFIEHGARLGKKNKLKEKVIDYCKKYEHPKLLVMVEAEEERRAAKRAP